jgi:hypothetical protein
MDFTNDYSNTEYFVQFTQNTAFLSEGQIWPSARIWTPSLHIYIYIWHFYKHRRHLSSTICCNRWGCVPGCCSNFYLRVTLIKAGRLAVAYIIQYQHQRKFVISVVCDVNTIITVKRRNGSKCEIWWHNCRSPIKCAPHITLWVFTGVVICFEKGHHRCVCQITCIKYV